MNTQMLSNDFLELEYLTDSLRIIGLTPKRKTNLFADLSHLPPITTPYGDFRFHGGHRLWHAPESMPRTYIPDTPVTVTKLSDGVLLDTQTEAGTGIRKRIEIRLANDKPALSLTHTLINDGFWAVELAPWAITQFRLGGRVILPMPVGNADPAGLLHNRQFALWSYARINDPRVTWGDEFVMLKADALLPPFKMGYFNPHGWMGYWLDGILFRKTFEAHTEYTYPDNNSNSEVYCNDQFVELESLGQFGVLKPGEIASHVEIWELFDNPDILPKELRQSLAG